jgi:hypothetical protein
MEKVCITGSLTVPHATGHYIMLHRLYAWLSFVSTTPPLNPGEQNNMADVTAKGESVANLADILGTVGGIVSEQD